jgi:zinc transport system ATP-binding protein
MNLINVENLSVSYGLNTVLRGVDFKIELGEIVTVVGPNGSGKTSLLKAIIGAIKPAKGSITLKPRLKIGYVPQRLNFQSTLPITVERFVRLTGKIDQKSCISALEIAGVSELLKSQMSELSGGQFQRVLLARALLGDPEILILDEATQGLDQPGSASFYRQLETVRQDTGCAVLMISHDLHVVMSASDRVICLNGHVCCAGTPAVVASTPEYKALFGDGTDGALALYRHDHGHDHSKIKSEQL